MNGKNAFSSRRETAPGGIEVIGAVFDSGEPKEIQDFVCEHRVTYRQLLGNDDMAEAFGGNQGFPTTFVINANGLIRLTIDTRVRSGGDEKRPIVSAAPRCPAAKAFFEVASPRGGGDLEAEHAGPEGHPDRLRRPGRLAAVGALQCFGWAFAFLMSSLRCALTGKPLFSARLSALSASTGRPVIR